MKDSEIMNEMMRYLTGEASEEEKELFLSSLDNDEEKRKLYLDLEEEWIIANNAMLHKRIDLDGAWLRQKNEYMTEPVSIALKNNGFWVKWAAAIVIGVGLSFYFISNSFDTDTQLATVETGQGEVLSIELTDGSVVTLNQNTRLDYEINQNGRKVIFAGEAYFEIAPDAKRPFLIEMNQAYVKVLGTKFNIRSNDLETKVSVTEGTVEFGVSDGTKISILKSGREAKISDKKLSDAYPMNENNLAWFTHQLVFDRTPLPVVFADLSNTYHSNFQFEVSKFDNCHLTGDFKNEDLKNILASIQTIFQVDFEANGDSFIVKGLPCDSQ